MIASPVGTLFRAVTAAGLVVVGSVELVSVGSWLSVPAGIAIAILATLVFGRLVAPAFRGARLGGLGLEGAAIGLVLAITLTIAVVAAPNTWDSMTYHLPRIDHWLLRGSVSHYATAIDRQVWQPPFAEYLVLVARSLGGGGDRWANLPQWLASLGCAVGAARIVTLLGLPSRAAWTAALVAITIPAVVVQSTSTQNDLLAAFWIVVAASLVLETMTDSAGESPWPWVGGALALAIGTKGTALVFGLPWLALFGWLVIRRSARHGMAATAGAALIVALVNAPWIVRNFDSYGNPLGDPVVQQLLRPASLQPNAIVANLVANGSVHWGLPIPAAERVADAAVDGALAVLGVDAKALFPYFGGFRVVPWSTDEDETGNPLLFGAGLVAALLAGWRWRKLGRGERFLTIAIGAGLLLFGLGVRWQPFNGRLQLPGFAMLVPLVVGMLWRSSPGMARAFGLAGALLAGPQLLTNASRPLVGGSRRLGDSTVTVPSILGADRASQYFARIPDQGSGFRQVIDRLVTAKCAEVALKTGYDSWEYPLWALARDAGASIRWQQNWVENATRKHQPPAPMPCAVVALDQPATWVPVPFTEWPAVVREGRITLWMPATPPPRTP